MSFPNMNFGQAPTMGTANNFVLFTTIGAVTNSGISHITGNVGTNSATSTGFGNVNGVMDDNNPASVLCSTDLQKAYQIGDSLKQIKKLPFSLGYHWGSNYQNLIKAERKG